MPRQVPHMVVGSEGKTLSVLDGSTWIELPGVNDWNNSGGGREGRSTTSDSGNPTGLAGAISAPSMEFPAYAVPGHQAWEVIRQAYLDNDEVRLREETPSQTLVAQTSGSVNAAIAATGVVTFTGTPRPTEDDLRLGSRIRVGTTDYIIASVNPETLATTVDPAPASAVTGANYSIRTPILRREFAAKVLETPDMHGNITQGGEFMGTLRVQLRGALPAWSTVAPA